jgi:hypothetical protein
MSAVHSQRESFDLRVTVHNTRTAGFDALMRRTLAPTPTPADNALEAPEPELPPANGPKTVGKGARQP